MFKEFSTEPSSQVHEVEKTKSLSQEELRERYEVQYRDKIAEKFRGERKRLLDNDEQRKKELETQLSRALNDLEDGKNEKKLEIDGIAKNIHNTEIIISNFRKGIKTLEEKKNKRSLVSRLKYTFLEDPFEKEKEQFLQEIQSQTEKREVLKKKVVDIETYFADRQSELQQQNEGLKEKQKQVYMDKKRELLDKIRAVNDDSKEAIKQTFLSMERGDLDVAKLAIENNALVVHAIPIDGWSMKNTTMNNNETDVTTMSPRDKLDTIITTQPDLSASVLSAGNAVVNQDMFYPFGYILDGQVIASYEGDEGTITDGTSRRRKEEYHGTLQQNVPQEFKTNKDKAGGYSIGGTYNEAIIHKPVLRAVLIDERKLEERPDLGDVVNETLPLDRKEEVIAKYGDDVIRAEGVPKSGPFQGKEVIKISRQRSAVEKAIEFAKTNNPNLPVYFRRKDGIYNQDGKKVNASDIYQIV